MAKGFAKISTGNADVNRLEEKIRVGLKTGLGSVESSISSINGGIANGVLLEGVSATTTPTDFHHGLGRVPKGVLVVKTDAFVEAPVVGSSQDDTQYINLDFIAAATVSLWVF